MKNKLNSERKLRKKKKALTFTVISHQMEVSDVEFFAKFGTFLKEPKAQLCEPWKSQVESNKFQKLSFLTFMLSV